MEKHIVIRDKNNKRLFDAIIANGAVQFEIKDNRGFHKISLREILDQINISK